MRSRWDLARPESSDEPHSNRSIWDWGSREFSFAVVSFAIPLVAAMAGQWHAQPRPLPSLPDLSTYRITAPKESGFIGVRLPSRTDRATTVRRTDQRRFAPENRTGSSRRFRFEPRTRRVTFQRKMRVA
jgi:hypothetical protein